ncbi:MAG: phage integrase N-terminal domain-containing protein [Cellvibrionaceae bacterium]
MKKLWYELRNLCTTNFNGSRATQGKRYRELRAIAKTLESLGFRHMGKDSLKEKHIWALINYWRDNQLSIGTIKTRMTVLRWWASKIGKHNLIAGQNEYYGIGKRTYITLYSKACDVKEEQLNRISDQYVLLSLKLAKLFGLRKEESIKFSAGYADKGDHIKLKSSWCKGGRSRVIPVLNQEQRELLSEIKALVGSDSLIPNDKKFIQQYKKYEKSTHNAGLRKLHGLRHQYAQNRYFQLTGWECSHRGGPMFKQLGHQQKQIDREARLILARELGHERLEVVAIYIGR